MQPLEHVENAESKRRVESLLAVNGVLEQLERLQPREATDEEIARVHTREHIERIEALSQAGGGIAGLSTPVGVHSARAARLAAGAGLTAVEAALTGGPTRAYCLVRPPGHHAERDNAQGYCIFNNVAIAACEATRRGVERVAIVDWDVHHGNGTQQAFWDDPSVLFISMHQDGLFPLRSGALTDLGGAGAEGRTINVPLPPGSGHGAYLAAFERIVLPALAAFAPGMVLVSAGQDGGFYDPMARQMCVAETYRAMTAALVAFAEERCEGRLVMLHEGGYSSFHTPFLTAAIVCELAGLPRIKDPSLAWTLEIPGQDLQAHQAERIDEVLRAHAAFGLVGTA